MSDTHQPPAAPLPPQDPPGDEAQATPAAASDETQALTAPPELAVANAAPAPALAELSPAQSSARLAALFPALFAQHQPQPLKLRIQADVQARAPGVFTRKSLSAFLHRYTTGTPYLQALTRAPQRLDLDGQPAGEIADEHREAATNEVARRRALVDERRAAEQNARREADTAARQQREADQQGRRERASLLRAFESSTLTRANFCALKGIAETELDAQLALARQEAAERAAWPAEEERGARRQEGRPADQRPRGPGGPGPGRQQANGGPPGAVTPGDRPAGGPGNRPRRPRPGP